MDSTLLAELLDFLRNAERLKYTSDDPIIASIRAVLDEETERRAQEEASYE